MQKTKMRAPASSSKVAKKARKMGTPSPPKKKKTSEPKSDEAPVKTVAVRNRAPVKKVAVVSKKGNVDKKNLKIAKKKVTPLKTPVNTNKNTAVKVVRKVSAKKVIKPKVASLTKINSSGKTAALPDAKTSDKSENSDGLPLKQKKVKKSSPDEQSSQNEPVKSTAKKQLNSKLNKKSNDLDTAVKQTLPLVQPIDAIKDVSTAPTKKSSDKKVKTDLLKSKAKKKVPNKVKKLLQPEKKVTPKKGNIKIINSEINEKIKTETIVKEKSEVHESEKVQENVDKLIEPNKKQIKKMESNEINSKETIAKLLKEANKTILKGVPRKKRDLMKIKIIPTSAIVKKSKITKIKPKKNDKNQITVKKELEDEKDDLTNKKGNKKIEKPKKKVSKNEDNSTLKEETQKGADVKEDKKVKSVEEEHNTNTDDSTTSDELTLNLIREQSNSSTPTAQSEQIKNKEEPLIKPKIKKSVKIKSEPLSDSEKKGKTSKLVKKKSPKSIQHKKKILLLKKNMRKIAAERKRSASTDTEQKGRKLKLYSWWTGPKRHRVASLNALAKVHCLYENESRSALYDVIKRSPPVKESNSDPEHEPTVEPIIEASTRTLRSVPGLRGVGKHWEMHDETSSSSSSSEENSNDSSVEEPKRKLLTPPPSYKQKQREIEKKPEEKEKKKPVRKRRNRTELIMDLKDMVVRKRMASLNASAILAASYSVEKKPFSSPKSETSESDDSDVSDASVMSDIVDKKRQCYDSDVNVKKEDSQDRKVIEVRASPNKKVAVILNQDTDVTITGVYVNSTTRSHHEGFCSIAGMQYRISATSHTQTAATAVATETLLHSTGEHGTTDQPCKSYTPLGALSNMQPPGSHAHSHAHAYPHGAPVSPGGGRRHGCNSAFSAPPVYGPPAHHHPPASQGPEQTPAYLHGYYQPAGPLITAHHGHTHPPPAPVPSAKAPLPTLEASPSPTPPPTTHQPPPSSTGTAESSDNEVIITSASSGTDPLPVPLPPPAQTYRYATTQYPPGGSHAPPGYSYTYPPSQYYHSAPSGFAQQQHFHHDICYPSTGYPQSYLHPKPYATTFRRYLPPPGPAGPQYYTTNPELYSAPPSSGQSSQVVSASSGASGSSYQPSPPGPPPPTLVETYAPPPPVPPTIVESYPPPHYYASYGAGPAPPPCYSHTPPTRNLAFIDAAYQSCPCPMQSCPKNVHTGPLTGDGKRSNATSIAKESMPLPPVALALPLEPASVAGPPSPARGSAGMPPPPSPAGATYQPTPAPKWDAKQESIETVLESKTVTTTEKRTKARLGKTMVRNSITSSFNSTQPQGMLLMCHNQQPLQPEQAATDVSNVKREVESPEEVQSSETINLVTAQKPSLCMEPINQTVDSKTETEVQRISEECQRRLSLDEVNQNVKNEDCQEQCEPVVQNIPVRRKSTLIEDDKLPQSSEETAKQINHLERICIKRKHPAESAENGYKEQVKKQKTNSKTKINNGSYKDLIKKSNRSMKINIGNAEIKPVEPKFMVYKTPKIVLNRKKTTKRKQSSVKEEPVAKRVKTSKPLVASNLHNLKQNVKYAKDKHVQISSNLTENKEPVKKSVLKKTQVNSKSSSNLNNVDRTIESVILNSAYTVEDSRTSVKDNILKQVTDKQTDSAPNKNNTTAKLLHRVTKIGSGRSGTSKRKTKINACPVPLPIPRIPRKSLQLPRWSNGWSWEGEPFQGKVFLNSDEALVARRCYPSMRHTEGDIISPRDCVLLKAGPRKIDLPFVAKVAALWEDEEGEMMMSLLWYYRPEHTEQGRRALDQPDEVFASRHKDTNSVACIEDKCYVLTFNEYCRYRKSVRSIEEGMSNMGRIVPLPEGGSYYREHRQPPPQLNTSPDLVFFCRQVYDFRQKRIVKNPS